jgi:hypothetical protein
MAKKKIKAKKKKAAKKKPAPKKKVTLRGKPAPSKTKSAKRVTIKKPKSKTVQKKKTAPREPSSGSERSSLGSGIMRASAPPDREGLGDESAGQSGDSQGLSRIEESNSESVEELIEEGQSYEAEVVDGVENTPDADQGEVRTHERPEGKFPSDDGEE